MIFPSIILAASLVTGGKPEAAVVTECDLANEPQIEYASQELTNWVAKISGAEIPVLRSAGSTPSTTIYIGTPATSKTIAEFVKKHQEDYDKIGVTDGFIIAEEGNAIYLVGKKTKGALNAVYRFLEKNSDIIWARNIESEDGFGTVYTKKDSFSNSVKYLLDVPKIGPSRYFRGTVRWQARNLCNETMHGLGLGKFDEKRLREWGRMYDNTELDMGVGLQALDKYKESDPDVFPLYQGKRSMFHDHQLCFMNPKTAELMAKEIVADIKNNKPASLTHVWMGLGDNWSTCSCDEYCAKPIDLEQLIKDGLRAKISDPNHKVIQPSDPNFLSTQYAIFIRRVSDLVRKECPQIEDMPTGMYLFLTEAPGIVIEAGSGCYCPYVKNHKKPVYDDGANEVWHKRAEGFYKIGMSFPGIYEYYLCSTTPRFPHMVCDVAQKDMQYYLSHGPLTSFYLDCNAYDEPQYKDSDGWCFDVSGIEFWTMARLMWNPDADIREIRREYCRRVYHEAADIMIGYYEKLAEIYNGDSAGCFWNDSPDNAMKYYIVEKGLAGWMRETLAKALAAAKNPKSREHIRRHADRMLPLLEKAEKAPKKITLVVPQILEKPSMDTNDVFWTKSVRPRPLTWVAKPDRPSSGKMDILLGHDRLNLYVMTVDWLPENVVLFDKYFAAGEVGKPAKPGEPFKWETPIEIYLDGDRAQKGSYYMFSYMMTERRFTGFGSSGAEDDPVKWTVKIEKRGDTLFELATFPLADIGVDISKGNKIGAMFVGGGHTAWNGGQWHSPTSFQTLVLEMK